MVDREILKQMGFVRGTGWDHEVWYWGNLDWQGADFWVHFGDHKAGDLARQTVDGRTVEPEEFFRKFCIALESRECDSY